jgi:hypothetical protein
MGRVPVVLCVVCVCVFVHSVLSRNLLILVRVQGCNCDADNGPFRKHCFDYYEVFLRIALKECRNTQKEILCISCLCIPVHVRLVL